MRQEKIDALVRMCFDPNGKTIMDDIDFCTSYRKPKKMM